MLLEEEEEPSDDDEEKVDEVTKFIEDYMEPVDINKKKKGKISEENNQKTKTLI